MPTSCFTSRHSAWLLMRAEARGESGILTASTPTDFRNFAPSSSRLASMPRGGTISTMVTNLPLAILRPSLERSLNGGGSTGLDSVVLVTLYDDERAAPTRRNSFMAWICSGVVPQQPPIRRTPLLTKPSMKFAMYSGEHR